jgi:hypothetical protein
MNAPKWLAITIMTVVSEALVLAAYVVHEPAAPTD